MRTRSRRLAFGPAVTAVMLALAIAMPPRPALGQLVAERSACPHVFVNSPSEVRQLFEGLERRARIYGPYARPGYWAIKREGYRRIETAYRAHQRLHRVIREIDLRQKDVEEKTKKPPTETPELPKARELCIDIDGIVVAERPEDASPGTQAGLERLLRELEREIAKWFSDSRLRTVGGTRTQQCENLDTVAVLDAGGAPFCSGLLVTRGAVLTAAHCACDLKSRDGSGRGNGTVVLGETVDPSAGPMLIRRGFAEIEPSATRFIDPGYDCRLEPREQPGRDLALLRLRSQLVEATTTATLPCPAAKPTTAAIAPVSRILDPAVTTGRVSGFGRSDKNTYGEKYFADLVIYSRICGFETTEAAYGCAGGRETILFDPAFVRDTCAGDSGGPVYLSFGRDGPFLAFAITSRGVGSGCGGGGVYSLITPAVVEWMRGLGVEPTLAR